MKMPVKVLALVLAMLLAVPMLAQAAQPKKYQVTGVVLALTADVITIEKGKGADAEKWEIARDAATKVVGDLKVGARVTLEYTMAATAIEVKEKAPATPAK